MEQTQANRSSLYVEVDPDLRDLFPSYLKKRLGELKSIEILVSNNRLEVVESIGHKLSGNAALFGLDELGKKGHRLEQAAKASNTALVLELAYEMLIDLEQVRLGPPVPPAPPALSK